MARIRYDASDWTPKSATVVDSAELTSHSEDSERVLRADSGGKNAWLPPAVDNLWGERPVGYRRGTHRDVTTNKLIARLWSCPCSPSVSAGSSAAGPGSSLELGDDTCESRKIHRSTLPDSSISCV
eukprot:SAG31_NODE_12236_length_956_cov_5.985998_2_plen_125_part_01